MATVVRRPFAPSEWTIARTARGDGPRSQIAGVPWERLQDFEGSIVRSALIIPVEDALEHRSLGRDGREERRAGSELEVIGGAEDLSSGAPLHAKDGLRALQESRAQDRVTEVGARFIDALDGVHPRNAAVTEPFDLGENVPHPVGALPPGADLGDRGLVVLGLSHDEAIQIERIAHVLFLSSLGSLAQEWS